MLVENRMAPVEIKVVRDALGVPRLKVDEPAGGGGGVDDSWFQVQLINPSDTGDMLDSATAEHRSMGTYEIAYWYHQFAIVLGGEMVVQDLATGEVYRAHEGDVFHWAPGHIMRLGGKFLALGVRSPIPQRWVKSAKGKKEVVMHTLTNEILLQGAAPDEIRPERKRMRRRRMKLVRGATRVEMPGGNGAGDCRRVMLMSPRETDFIGSASIEERTGGTLAESSHLWHQVGFVLSGELVTENLNTGEVFRIRQGDLFYWGPGLRHSIEGEYRIYTVMTPEPIGWLGECGQRGAGDLDVIGCPAAKPDAVSPEVLIEA